MRKIIDVIGKTFGYWTVTGPIKREAGKIYYLCKCKCGTERYVQGTLLRSGNSKSCGCLRVEKLMSKKDVSGTRFGYLTAVRPEVVNNRTYWRCRCDCGNEGLFLLKDLRYGSRKTCGCRINFGDNIREGLKEYCVDGTYVPGLHRAKVNSNNTSGVTGVSYRKDRNKWRASIKIQNKDIFLGNYDTKEDAILARKLGEEKYFGKYINNQSNCSSNNG